MVLSRVREIGTIGVGALLAASLLISSETMAQKKKRKAKKESGEAAAVEKSEAETTNTQSVARERYSKGKALYDEGKFEEALIEFQAAYDVKPHPTVLKSIAECQVQTGDVTGATATLDKYLASEGITDRAEVEARIAELKEKSPSEVTVTSEPPGAKIAVAGVDTGEVTPATLSLNPGEYAIELTIDGMDPVQKNITVKQGEETAVDVQMAADASSMEEAPGEDVVIDPFEGEAPLMEEPELESEDSGPPKAFWALAAVTGAALVSGTVFGTMALGDEDDYKKEPTQSKKEAGRRDAILADVSFGIAGAAAIVGTIVFVTHLKKSKSESAKVHLLPVASQQEVGLSASVHF